MINLKSSALDALVGARRRAAAIKSLAAPLGGCALALLVSRAFLLRSAVEFFKASGASIAALVVHDAFAVVLVAALVTAIAVLIESYGAKE